MSPISNFLLSSFLKKKVVLKAIHFYLNNSYSVGGVPTSLGPTSTPHQFWYKPLAWVLQVHHINSGTNHNSIFALDNGCPVLLGGFIYVETVAATVFPLPLMAVIMPCIYPVMLVAVSQDFLVPDLVLTRYYYVCFYTCYTSLSLQGIQCPPCQGVH